LLSTYEDPKDGERIGLLHDIKSATV